MSKEFRKYISLLLVSGMLAMGISTKGQDIVIVKPISTVYFNEQVYISGSTSLKQVVIRVKDKSGKIIYIDTEQVVNGNFENHFRMPIGATYGEYTVQVGSASEFAMIEFTYTQAPIETVDKAKLRQMIQLAKRYTSEGYTVESWNRLQQVIDVAQVIYEESNVTKYEIETAIIMLENAINALQMIPSGPGEGGEIIPPKPGEGGGIIPPKPGEGGGIIPPKPGEGGEMMPPKPPEEGEEVIPPRPEGGGGMIPPRPPEEDEVVTPPSTEENQEIITQPDTDKIILAGENAKLGDTHILATDLRQTQKEEIIIGIHSDFVNELKEQYPNRAIKDIEIVIQERENEALTRKIDLGLKVNNGEILMQGKIPPVEIIVTPKLSSHRVADYLALKYIDEVEEVIYGEYYEGKYLRFLAQKLGSYGVAYCEKSFEDLAAASNEAKSINILAANGIVNGVSESHFAPQKAISRAEYLVLLMRNLNLKAEIKSEFKDISRNAYYYEAVNMARTLGIVKGSGNNAFKPNQIITKDELLRVTEKALEVAGLGSIEFTEFIPHKTISRLEAAQVQFEVYKEQQKRALTNNFEIHIVPQKM